MTFTAPAIFIQSQSISGLLPIWLFPSSSEKNVNYQESTEQWGWMMDRSCREEHVV